MLENAKGAANSQDGLIIWGETPEELQNRTIDVFESIRKQGLKLNKIKSMFNKSEIICLGHRITGKVYFQTNEAVTDMPHPTDVKELQRLLGMVNYLGKFIPNLLTHSFNL